MGRMASSLCLDRCDGLSVAAGKVIGPIDRQGSRTNGLDDPFRERRMISCRRPEPDVKKPSLRLFCVFDEELGTSVRPADGLERDAVRGPLPRGRLRALELLGIMTGIEAHEDGALRCAPVPEVQDVEVGSPRQLDTMACG